VRAFGGNFPTRRLPGLVARPGARPVNAEVRPPRFFVPVAWVLLAAGILVSVPGRGADLEAAERLVDAGSPALALAKLSRKPPEAGAAAWPRWSRLRLRALQAQGKWRRVIRLVGETPESAPAAYRKWAAVRAARLELDHHRPEDARRRMAGLVAAFPRDERVRSWLQLVYRAYDGEGRKEDARVAVLRHRLGHDRDDQGLSPLGMLRQAQVLAGSGAPGQALEVLGDEPGGPRRRQLRIRLLLRTGSREQALAEARKWADDTSGRDARLAWEAVAEAAGDLERLKLRVTALEKVLGPQPLAGKARSVRVERAWEAYLRRGELLGNQAGLLVGDDADWLELARTTGKGPDRRALLASEALLGRTASARQSARLTLIDALADAGLPGTAIRLFAEGPAFQDPGSLSPLTLARLSELALAEKRFSTALSWMDRVADPPEAMAPAPWLLNRARLRVQLGRYEGGADDVQRIIDHPDWLADGDFRDRLLQVLFDLQKADRDAVALRLFRGVYDAVDDGGARRELLFWRAECRESLGEHQRAATLYLRSAAHPDGEMGDPWSRTARFRAAKALAQTAYTDDARRLFRKLLGTGSSRQDVAILRHLHRLETGEGG